MKQLQLSVIVLIMILMGDHAHAKGPQALTDLTAALESAKTEGKMLIIQYGREACGNCQALKTAIAKGEVKLPKDRFIYVDLNCDDPKTQQSFSKNFKVEGKMLPFVVIADSEGKQLVSRAGYGAPEDFKKMIKEASKQKAPIRTPGKSQNRTTKPLPSEQQSSNTPIPVATSDQ